MKAWLALTSVLLLTTLALAHPPTEPKKPAAIPAAQTALPAGESCALTLKFHRDNGDFCPATIRIRRKGETAWLPLPGLLPRMLGLSEKDLALGWHVVAKEQALALPRAELELEAFAGIFTPLHREPLDLRGRDSQVLELALNPASPAGWVAGNPHVHLKMISKEEASRYLVEVARADGLQAVYLSYVERAVVDRDYTSNLFTDEDFQRLSSPDLVFGNGEEYRHNIGAGGEGYGHVLLLNLRERILPASLGPGITKQGDDGTPLRPGLERARADAATIIWCHNKFGREDIPSWLAGLVDAQNIFDGGSYGGYEDTYYRYLNLGLRVPFSTGTDWFIYDLSRVHVRMEESDPLAPASWLKALRSGRSVITNGTWIDFTVDTKEAGETLELAGPGKVRISAAAKGRANFGKLEIVKNGAVIETVYATQGPEFHAAKLENREIAIDGPCWIAARITPPDDVVNELGGKPFAHTSPVYVKVGGKGVFLPETAAQVRAELNADVEAVIKDGSFSDSGQKFALRQLYDEALEALVELEKQHKSP